MKARVDWPYEFPGAYWLDRREEAAVLDVLRHGSLFRYYGIGEPRYSDGRGRPTHVDRYEAGARGFYGVPYALAVNSGTGALITALRALGIGPGAEVIVPAFLWVASVGAVVQVGAIPVLCEVDDSLTMDPADLARKITPRTRLILPIHMAGAPSDVAAITRLAADRDIPVLEDCAQCNGGSVAGRRVGTWGDIGIFSLQLNKNMTCGEGGLLITREQRLYERAFAAHDMGLIRVKGRLAVPEPHAIMWGGGRRMTELAGAVAEVQLRKLPRIIAHMRASKQRLKEMLAGTPGLAFRRLHDEAGDTGCFLIIMLASEAEAVRVTDELVAAGMHNVKHVANYGMHIYSNIPSLVEKVPLSPAGDPWSLQENRACRAQYTKGTCPRSDALFARSVLIPIPSRLTRAQERAGAAAIRAAVAG
jgi:dTDP-4-amino-4,6-dideoxygalactose transaminase